MTQSRLGRFGHGSGAERVRPVGDRRPATDEEAAGGRGKAARRRGGEAANGACHSERAQRVEDSLSSRQRGWL